MLIRRVYRRSASVFGRALTLAALLMVPAVPVQAQAAAQGQGQPEGFIVVLKDGFTSRAPDVAAEHSRRFNGQLMHVYEHALKGYAAKFAPGVIGAIAADSRVAYVERDGVARTQVTTQSNATWGLDRIDQQAKLDVESTYDFTYTSTGVGVTAYVIDTGIQASHAEFVGRIRTDLGFSSISDGNGTDDCNGHGTHVAGTVGGTTYGVAKSVTLVPVRVLDCSGSGTWSGVIAGIDWVTAKAQKPAVANMSLGGGASTAVDSAVKTSIAAGVSYAIAAGNGNLVGIAQDACKSSPARVDGAMTIGATDRSDRKTSWSNYGKCVDWFAPGSAITSAWIGDDRATNTISGTSMATPHTAGVAALYLQKNPGASPATVRAALYNNATKGVVTSSKTANNHLLYSNPES